MLLVTAEIPLGLCASKEWPEQGPPFGSLLRALLCVFILADICSLGNVFSISLGHLHAVTSSSRLTLSTDLAWPRLRLISLEYVSLTHDGFLKSLGFKPRGQEDPFRLFPSAPHNARNCLQRYGIETGMSGNNIGAELNGLERRKEFGYGLCGRMELKVAEGKTRGLVNKSTV